MTKIYTKTGDGGETGLFAGPRVSKDDPRIEAYGTVDELNSFLGVVRTESLPEGMDNLLGHIQNDLFTVGAELATPRPEEQKIVTINEAGIHHLEQNIDHWQSFLPELRQFILPGGTSAAAWLHIARCVCRRAERRVVTLRQMGGPEPVSELLVRYLNRLSDLLFVLARAANSFADQDDVHWQQP